MTIRLLQTPSELEEARRLRDESEPCGAFYPNSDIVGAFADGELVGVLGVETCFFLGPLVVRREWRGRQVPAQLVEFARRGMGGHRVLLFTANSHVKKLAEEYGMYQPKGEFYMREVA